MPSSAWTPPRARSRSARAVQPANGIATARMNSARVSALQSPRRSALLLERRQRAYGLSDSRIRIGLHPASCSATLGSPSLPSTSTAAFRSARRQHLLGPRSAETRRAARGWRLGRYSSQARRRRQLARIHLYWPSSRRAGPLLRGRRACRDPDRSRDSAGGIERFITSAAADDFERLMVTELRSAADSRYQTRAPLCAAAPTF